MNYAPIALFVYNRPEHTQRTIEAIKANAEAADSHLYIFSDAPKDSAASPAVAEIREYIHAISGFQDVTVIEREYNLGLANSIISGVTQLCEQHGRVIVLEDDLLVSEHFLTYMNQALETYESYDEVMQISGYMFPVEVAIEEDAFFLPFTTSWGWATWQRAWQKFDPSAGGYARLSADRKLQKAFDLNGAYPYYKMLQSQLKGEINSWAVRWNLSVFMCKGLVLFPKQTLVHNAGFDGSGVHCGSQQPYAYAAKGLHPSTVNILPSAIQISEEGQARVYGYLRSAVSTPFTKFLKFFRRLWR